MGYLRGGTYWIARTIAGRRLRFSTGCVTLDGALEELRKFEANPSGYITPRGKRVFARPARRGNSDPQRAAELRDNYIARKFRLDTKAYALMLAEQGGRCAICGGEPENTRHGVLDVDHCHTSGVVRGLLCNLCNRGIGSLRDSPDLLRKAAVYLEARGPEVAPQPEPEKERAAPEPENRPPTLSFSGADTQN